mmetsp:Transcript_172704/g.553539  ORF Transcript_172704/g.553539 Transcript_172704/m.553539 type:complete len:1016 (-) Transcript_172704:503-3550(-)
MRYCLTPYLQAPQALVAQIPELAKLAVQDDGRTTLLGVIAASATGRIPDSVPDSATAYILFTSGSTGKPKGCMVPHRGSALYAHAVVQSCALDDSMTFLFKTPYVFDVSIQDIYTAFSAGGKLAIAEAGMHKDASALASFVAESGVNCMAFTPTLLVEFVNYLALNQDVAGAVGRSLRRVLTIGEALMSATCRQLFALVPQLDGELHNLYGPTEASVGVSHLRVSSASLGEGAVVPIGRPFGYVNFKVFDPALYEGKDITPELLVEVPPGETGELFIGGDCLAQGYVRDPSRTGAAFFAFPQILARPVGAASKFSLYKTGDLVRRRDDGTFEIFGRTDFQVKIGGVRIECEEISAVLKGHPLVDDCLVTAFEGPYGKALAAYVVSQDELDWLALDSGDCSDIEVSPSDSEETESMTCGSSSSFGSNANNVIEEVSNCTDLLVHMATLSARKEHSLVSCNKALQRWVTGTSLLPVMRPKVYILLGAFPKNTAGKVDRGSLPSAREALDTLVGSGSEEFVSPASDEDILMAECWERVLGIPVSMETPFATYGGHSLMALALRSEITKHFGTFPALTSIMAEDGTPRKLLEEMHSQGPVQDKDDGEVQFPFVVGRTISTLFHFDNIDPGLYMATHKALRTLPAARRELMYSQFVPSFEVQLENPMHDLEELVAKLLEAHPILLARCSRQRQLVIPSAAARAREYCSWDTCVSDARYAILGMYSRPLFHIVGHSEPILSGTRKVPFACSCLPHEHGPAVRMTVVWNHIIMDGFSEGILRRSIAKLAREKVLEPTNLRVYDALANHPLAMPVMKVHTFDKFSLPRRQACSLRHIRGKVVHTARMMAAVSFHAFDSDMDRAHFFLDAFCKVTGQTKGRFGLVTNARARVDVDASDIVGALIYNVEYSYDSSAGKLECLGNACDAKSGLAFNMHNQYADMTPEGLVEVLGFKHPTKVAAGDVDASVVQSVVGAMGANFVAGDGLYAECLPVVGATVFFAIYPDTNFKAQSIIRSLHQRLCDS